jgi:hypothetical protein
MWWSRKDEARTTGDGKGKIMFSTWDPGIDAEIGYRMERAKVDFRRHRGTRVGTETHNQHTRTRFGRRPRNVSSKGQ